jgi:hypothetical protein
VNNGRVTQTRLQPAGITQRTTERMVVKSEE